MSNDHRMLGRIAGATGIATFCSCGNAYYGASYTQADRRWTDHRNEIERRSREPEKQHTPGQAE